MTLKSIYFNIVWKWEYEELPSVFKRYITLRASGRAATQLVTNPQLVQLLATQESQARAACMEYECNQGDHTFFGTPDGTVLPFLSTLQDSCTMSAVSQSYPNYLGGLNEQPDELKKTRTTGRST